MYSCLGKRGRPEDTICISSVEQLETLSGQVVEDLHKHFVDEIIIERWKNAIDARQRVLDCWFESGSMPYAQHHYPFEQKEKFEANFPADFIAEGTRSDSGLVLHADGTLDGSF